jgi:toxin secretion/phage lysis holin
MIKININNILMAIIPASYFLWTDQFTGACMVLFVLMVLDFITGMRKASFLGEFSSTIAREKTVKKAIDYLTILIAGYLINMFYLSVKIDGYVADFIVSMIGGFIHCSFIVFVAVLIAIEFYSIIENLSKMGMPIPKKITDNWSKNIK